MIQKLDSITACNKHASFLCPFQYGGTASLSTRNLTGKKTASIKNPSSIGRCIWKMFVVKGKVSLRIETFYRKIPLAQGIGSGLVYSQHLTHFNRTISRIFPRQGFLGDLKEEVDRWKNSES